MANGGAGRCRSKSHFCPLGPVLTERGSRGEGEERRKEPTESFFPQRGFLSISARLSKQEDEAGLVRAPGGRRPGVGKAM